jgi:ATP synthase protein I
MAISVNKKLAELKKDLAEAKLRESQLATKKKLAFAGFATSSFSVALELMAGVFVGALMGYFIDLILGTKPWGLLVCLIFGAVGGFYNVYKSSLNSLEIMEKKGNE